MKDDNKYVFPCGDKFSAIDVGYCQGVKVATIANGSINWGIEKCANCKLANFREFYNIKNTVGTTEINAHGECVSPFAKAEGCSRRSGNLPPQTLSVRRE